MSTHTPTARQLMEGIGAETGLNPLGPTYIPSLDTFFPDRDLLSRFSTTEIQGPPKSGKTVFLLFLILTTLLPYEITLPFLRPSPTGRAPAQDDEEEEEQRVYNVALGGRGPGRAVLLFDADGRFPLLKLEQALLSHVRNRCSETLRTAPELRNGGWSMPSERILEARVRKWTKKVLVYRPTNQVALTASIKCAREHAMQKLPDCEVSLIVVDSLSPFYWQTRYETELLSRTATTTGPSSSQMPSTQPPSTLGAPASTQTGAGVSPSPHPHSPIKHPHPLPLSAPSRASPYLLTLQALHDLQHLTGAAIVLTNWALTEEKGASPGIGSVKHAPSQSHTGTQMGTGRGPSPSRAPSPLPGGRFWKQHLPAPFPAPFSRPTSTRTHAFSSPLRSSGSPSSYPSHSSSLPPLTLTTHLTLARPTPLPLPHSTTLHTSPELERTRQKARWDGTHGWVRIPGKSGIGAFEFELGKDGLRPG